MLFAARQVLSRALEALGLAFVPVDSPDAAGVDQNPAQEDAFMCNMQVCVVQHSPIAACPC